MTLCFLLTSSSISFMIPLILPIIIFGWVYHFLVECRVGGVIEVRRKSVLAILVGIALAGTVHANMMPVSWQDVGCRQYPQVRVEIDLEHTSSSHSFVGFPGAADLDLRVFKSLAEANAGPAVETRPLQPRKASPGALSLCLYALIGLGLCRSGHWFKRPTFGFLPDWHHHRNPCQIWHSHAAGPKYLNSATAHGLIQPGCTATEGMPPYCRGAVLSLLRNTQFTPSVVPGSRGPPSMLERLFPACPRVV